MSSRDGLDVFPDWPTMMKKGMGFEEYKRLMKEDNIKCIEEMLEEEREELTEEEISEALKIINDLKKEVNNSK